MKRKLLPLAAAALLASGLAAHAGTDMVSAHDYDISPRAWQPPPPPGEGAVYVAPPPPVVYYPPPPIYYPPPYPYGPYGYYGGSRFYGPAFYGPAIGIGFHIR